MWPRSVRHTPTSTTSATMPISVVNETMVRIAAWPRSPLCARGRSIVHSFRRKRGIRPSPGGGNAAEHLGSAHELDVCDLAVNEVLPVKTGAVSGPTGALAQRIGSDSHGFLD